MLKAIAFGICCGAGFQAWRDYPPGGPLTGDALAWVLVLAVLAAFGAGLWHSRGRGSVSVASATAVASASAESSSVGNTVNIAVLSSDPARPAGVAFPTEAVEWFGGGARRQVTADELDGADLRDFIEEVPETEAAP
jgi:hypothetical protein